MRQNFEIQSGVCGETGTPHPVKPPHSKSARGMALVIILAILALMLVLVVGFLNRSSTERASASSYHAGASARLLANDAVNLVQAQIDHAARAGTNRTWTSQPGLVRVFDASGNAVGAYKLYSAAGMSVSPDSLVTELGADLPGDGWREQPAVWVDINQRVVSDGGEFYPIMDPSLAPNGGEPDPFGGVEGFQIAELPGAGGNLGAMPVRWLYVLRDGAMVAPVSSSGTRVEFDPAVVNENNPIVGRVAFWTDDESCKVNVNTAGEGTYWDVPRAYTLQEYNLGNLQPAQGEFARYPGHPATTALSAVFPELNAADILGSGVPPRYEWGGSRAATVLAQDPVPNKSERLYASISEVLFDPDRSRLRLPPQAGPLEESDIVRRAFFLTAHSRAPETNLFNLPRVAIWPLHVNDDPNHRTPFDMQIARCSTINDQPYYFQRERAFSPTHDFANIQRNLDLYNYLLTLAGNEIPAFGGRFTSKYPSDMPQIFTQIFDYIRSANLVDPMLEQMPSGVVFSSKAALDSSSPHNMTPGYGTAAPIRHPTNNTMGFGRFYTLAEFVLHFICTADAGPEDPDNPGQPLHPQGLADSNIPPDGSGGPDGANRTLAVNTPLQPNQRRVQAMVHLRLFSPAQGWVTMHPQLTIEVEGLDTLRLEGEQLFPDDDPDVENRSIAIGRFGPDFGVHTTGFGANGGISYPLFSKRAQARGNLPADSSGSTAQDEYPFTSNFITVSGDSMAFTGGEVTVRIFSGNTINGPAPELVQTITLDVPDGPFPLPDLVTSEATYFSETAEPEYFWSFSQAGAIEGKTTYTRSGYQGNHGRLYGVAGRRAPPIGNPLHANDVIRSMIPRHGDHRLTAARHNVPVEAFVAHRFWNSTTQRHAHQISQGHPSNGWGPSYTTTGMIGSHIDPINQIPALYRWEIPFESPRNHTQPLIDNRDFDTGTAYAPDGPFINKPDEGNTYRGELYFADGSALEGVVPYMGGGNLVGYQGFTFFSPNRQMPSPGMFGSLPTGVRTGQGQPWRTLLFRPQENHPAWNAAPKDHLLMDLFWMPVVEPYAISEPFSTAGKVNMNYQIFPFVNIERSTGMRAVLKGEMLAAIPVQSASSYKVRPPGRNPPPDTFRFRLPIDTDETLKQFRARFNAGNVFRSASEICDLYIIPQGQTVNNAGVWTNRNTFWNQHRLTGDNLRERIYTTLYPRLTTRSNTFTVHVWSQVLRPAPGMEPHVWDEDRGAIAGSYRGSTTIERFIDPNNPDIPDYAAQIGSLSTLPGLDDFYRWRTVGNVQFAP